MQQAATQWAPPRTEQVGLIGTHWSKGWIIEDNVNIFTPGMEPRNDLLSNREDNEAYLLAESGRQYAIYL